MGKTFNVNYGKDDVRVYEYVSRNGKDHKIKLIKPSLYQINADSVIRENKHNPMSVVETEWFKQRNINLENIT